MTEKDYKKLVELQMQKSTEALDDAAYMIAASRWNAAANRLYYAC
jgi:hypothetical protein